MNKKQHTCRKHGTYWGKSCLTCDTVKLWKKNEDGKRKAMREIVYNARRVVNTKSRYGGEAYLNAAIEILANSIQKYEKI